MTPKKIIMILALTVVTYAFGRYSAPTKVVTETKVVEVEKKQDNKTTDKGVKRNRKTVTVVVTKPDGSREETTTVTENYEADTKTKDKSVVDSSTSTDSRTETTRPGSRTRISGLAGFSPFASAPPVYGGHVTTSVLGPINMGGCDWFIFRS
jgi:hypothetical protein